MADSAKTKKTDSDSKSTSSKATESSSSDSTTTSGSAGGGGKSSRESVGGASAVHYGYFSNIKSPEYKSGWDEIWGEKSKPRKKTAAKNLSQKTTRKKEPLVVRLSMDDLPESIRKGLAAAARDELKKSRVNYDNRQKAGAVSWRIECEIKR